MKKINFFRCAFLAPFIFSMFSCSPEKENSLVSITFGKVFDTSVSENNFINHSEKLSYIDLKTLVDNRKNFVVLFHKKDNSCTCWKKYEATLLRYMKANNALIYSFEIENFSENKPTFGVNYNNDSETIAIFKEGEIFDQYLRKGASDDFVEYDNFKSWMNERVSWSSMNYINKAQLDDLFINSPTPQFLVYFSRSSCGDCSYVDSAFLEKYNQIKRANSYIIDCDTFGIRLNEDGSTNEETWQTFKDDYGLSNKYNTSLGYGSGYVPTFIVYQKGEAKNKSELILDMNVTLNDSIVKDGENYKITDSFFRKERIAESPFYKRANIIPLMGLEIPAIEIKTYGEYVFWDQAKAMEKHRPLLETFLNNYLAK